MHSPSSSHNSNPTIASMRRHKTSLREIYDKFSEVDQDALFAFLTYHLESFEEEVKEINGYNLWMKKSMQLKNQSWDLVDLLADKTPIRVKWV